MEPLRCPACQALVMSRRSPVCTTCREPLPAEWVMSPAQAAKVKALDQEARANHQASMKESATPWTEPIGPGDIYIGPDIFL